MRTIRYQADDRQSGMQGGRFLRGAGYSGAVISLLKRNNGLHLNGEHIRTIDTINSGDILTVTFSEESDTLPNPGLHADIVYDDEDLVVFDKPCGMPVHTSAGHNDDTLANLFAAVYPDSYFHAVSRLDRNTSGLIVIAKNKFAASRLMSDENCRPQKIYFAVVGSGIAGQYGESGEISAPIGRENDGFIKRAVRADGEYARTLFRIVYTNVSYSLLEIKLYTGRTHQIRVHFSYIGFPLIGDDLYGGDTSVIHRQALHCGKLSLIHPVTGKKMSFVSTFPDDISVLFGGKIPYMAI
ncbi:MAG: RluA family pseudouridine synthase [Ruminiclostridium sp.]|nr:RluA family pseudouridine synthase [Ruminiclostridium sp.]